MSSPHKSIAGLLIIRFIVTTLLVWVLTLYLDPYFFVGGGWTAYGIVAALITLLNILLRPIINVVLLPLRFFATFLAVIAANAFFLWIVHQISLRFDPSVVTLSVNGWIGWIAAGLVFGITNWILTH